MQCVGVQVNGSAIARCAQRTDASSDYTGPFCQRHYAISRPLYERYKQTCDEAFGAVERALDTPDVSRRFLRAYALLTRGVEQRRRFMHLFVFPACHDDGHVFECRRLLRMRSQCEQHLRRVFATQSSVAQSTPSLTQPSESAQLTVATSEVAPAAAAPSERLQEAALRKFLDDAVREARAETARRDRVMNRLAQLFVELGDLSLQSVRDTEQSFMKPQSAFVGMVAPVVHAKLVKRMIDACLSARGEQAPPSKQPSALSARFTDIVSEVRDVCFLRRGLSWNLGASMHSTLLDYAIDILNASALTATDLNFVESVLTARAFRRTEKEEGRSICVHIKSYSKPDGAIGASILIENCGTLPVLWQTRVALASAPE